MAREPRGEGRGIASSDDDGVVVARVVVGIG